MRCRAATGIALIALLFAGAACGGGSDSSQAAKRQDDPRPERVSAADAADKPNVIFIYTDDQNLADFKARYMPQTFKLLANPGTQFSDFVVATPLCCPSRATYLTGDYPHNDGVFSNPSGYRHLTDKFNTLPVWMHNAGYRTAWVGKYLQGYEEAVPDPLKAAPGFDDWHATFDPLYYDYDIADNGAAVHHGSKPRDYYTNVITKVATDVIADSAEGRRPLYMTVNNLAPHHGGGDAGRCTDVVPPAPRDQDLYADAQVPRTPAWDEEDISDKPDFVPQEPLSAAKIERLDLAYGCRLASLRGVDRSVASIYRAVKRAGELDDTVFIFTSDNGILQGEHRIGGKNVPYEEGLRQPLVILAGRDALGSKGASEVAQLTANVDFAPTILGLGDAKPCARPGNCRKLDGQSLIPLLRGADPAAAGFPSDREILVEGGKGGGDCLYAGIRTPGLNYSQHAEEAADGSCVRDAATELYDLSGDLTGSPDPHELENLASPVVPASDDPDVQAAISRLSARLEELRACSGASCR
ncbi:MAG: sulfatase [Solirubrobacterales bacterium]